MKTLFQGLRTLLNHPRVGLVAVILFFLALGYSFGLREMRFFLVPSRSMEPTLLIGDQVVTLNKDTYHRGDLVVVWDAIEREHIVKRLVGLPGDRIEVRDGALFLNGAYASEPYIAEPMNYALITPAIVPEGQVFVLGDNRNESDDSHNEGRGYPLRDIVGTVRMIYFPYARFGAVPSFPLDRVLLLPEATETASR